MAFAVPLARRRLRPSPTPVLAGVVGAAALACLVAPGFAAQAPVSAAVASPPPAAAAPDGAAMLADIRALTAPGMDGRAVGTPGNAKARAWIVERLRTIGVVPMRVEPIEGAAIGRGSFEHPFTFTSKTGVSMQGVNLVATCGGQRPGPPLVVSAHYDHLGIRDGQTYHGADDNASGVALLLTVAERCVRRPFEHRLVLAFFDAEEQGLQGARAFLQSTIAIVPFALNLNFDMVGRGDRNELYVAGPGRWPALKPIVEGPASRASITVTFGHDTGGGQDDWTMQSDHGPFHEAGIPFVYLGVEDHADYHKPTDTPDKIDADFLGGVAAFVLDLVDALDRAPAFK
ncbi:MAG: M28 family peptidase [Vicinamibacterales bacterium]